MSTDPWQEDHARNVAFYTGLVAEHGVNPRALNWGSAQSQRLRFEILAEAGLRSGATVLDIGCGLGDLHGWLRETGVEVDYRGVDLTSKMVESARARFPEGRFDVADVLDDKTIASADFVFASGIFYLRQHEPFQFMQAMIARMFALCRVAVAFNSLSAWAPARDSGEFYADPLETLDFCRTLTPWVTLRHDYHPGDFTIHLHRQPVR